MPETAGNEKGQATFMERWLPTFSFVVLLANTAGGGFLFSVYGMSELTQKRLELAAEGSTRIKLDVVTSSKVITAPRVGRLGVYRVTHRIKITNTSKIRLRIGQTQFATYLGIFDETKIDKASVIALNGTRADKPIKWEVYDSMNESDALTDSGLLPGEEVVAELDFFVAAPEHSHLCLAHTFPVIGPNNETPWNITRIVSLREAVTDVSVSKVKD